jgi:hypothetical protein
LKIAPQLHFKVGQAQDGLGVVASSELGFCVMTGGFRATEQ